MSQGSRESAHRASYLQRLVYTTAMTTARPRKAPRVTLRWLCVLVVSILLHLLAIGHVTALIRLPSASTPAAEVITASLLQPPPPAAPVKPATVRKPRPKPKAKPMPPEIVQPAASASAPAVVQEPQTVATRLSDAEISEALAAIAKDNPVSEAASDDVPSPSYTIDLPPSATLEYDVQKTPVEGQPTYGSGTIAWHTDGQHYSVEGEFGVLFITALRFRSTGTIETTGIAPELYSEKRFRRAETNTHFHRVRNTISFSASTNSYPRNGTEQDRASIIWQLAGIGRGDSSQFTPGAIIQVVVAGTRDAEPWQIQIVDREDLEIDGKTISTWHVVRAPRARTHDQKLDIWLAPQLQWYPVRLRYTEPNGDHLDMTLTGLNVSALP